MRTLDAAKDYDCVAAAGFLLTSTSSKDITTAAAIDSHAPVRVASVRSLQKHDNT